MESESSLSLSQEPATCPYPEPAWSSPCSHPTSWRFILILSFHLHLGLPSGLFPSGFPTKLCTRLFSPPRLLKYSYPLVKNCSAHFLSILSPELEGTEPHFHRYEQCNCISALLLELYFTCWGLDVCCSAVPNCGKPPPREIRNMAHVVKP